jgi:SPP1 family predicted phage head-tail adaptor
MSAGELRDLVAFERRDELDDGYGNVDGAWVEQFRTAARIQPLKGGEAVQAARLAGTQPVVIRVRYCAAARSVAPAWRARDVRSGTIYNLRSAANMDEHRRYIDFLADAGVAT